MKPIPKSLLSLLSEPWQPAAGITGSAFQAVFDETDRRRDPSFYFAYEASRSDGADMLHFAEVVALLRDKVLTADMATVANPVSGPRQTVTNEHAQHAIIDFCEATYAAWETLQRRLDQIASACPPPRPRTSKELPRATPKDPQKQVLH
jgi:hypothetical protein